MKFRNLQPLTVPAAIVFLVSGWPDLRCSCADQLCHVLQFWRCQDIPTVADIRMRALPKIPVDTPMFDVLNLFQASITGYDTCRVYTIAY